MSTEEIKILGPNFIGAILKDVQIVEGSGCHNDSVVFTSESGDIWEMKHFQDCCETVTIEDVCGDLSDLVGSPILQAEGITKYEDPYDEWTFYRIGTAKGMVTIRWYGSSEYYSTKVDFYLKNA